MINTGNKKALSYFLAEIRAFNCHIRNATMENTTPNNPNSQPKQFRKDFMAFDLESTAQLLDDVAVLFAMIQNLLESDKAAARLQIKAIARSGQFLCEDWSNVIESMKDNLDKESLNYFH